jgi:hypothetical protein
MEDARTPLGDEARHALAEGIGADGASVLSAVYEAGAPGFLREMPAVQILRQVSLQNYSWIEGQIRWRSSEEIPQARALYWLALRCRGTLEQKAQYAPLWARRSISGKPVKKEVLI